MEATIEPKTIYFGGQGNALNPQKNNETGTQSFGGENAPIQNQSPEPRCESIFCQLCQDVN